MITVEELIIQSLYHRMVVVNVRRTPTVAPTGGRVDALGLLISGAQRMRSAMGAQGQLPANQGQGHSKCAQPESGGASGGEPPPQGAEGDSVMQVKSRQGTVDFSEEVQTILDTGEIKLVKAMQKTTETQTDFTPVWFFGFDPATNQPAATVTTPEGSVVAAEEPAMHDIPAVDLSRFEQFSVIHYSDTRDPDKRKLVMIQTPGSKMYTPEELCSENLSVQNRPTLNIPQSSRRQLFDRKSKSLDNSALMTRGSESRTQDHNVLKRQERVVEGKIESGDEGSHDGDISLRDPDIDSGIWDMVHGRDARLSSRDVMTPMTSPNVKKEQSPTGDNTPEKTDRLEGAGRDNAGACREEEEEEEEGEEEAEEQGEASEDGGTTWQEMYEQMGMSDGDRPTMSYRVFHIQDQVALDGDTSTEPVRLESPMSDRSTSPQPVNASTPRSKVKIVGPDEHEGEGESCREDHDSDLGTELRSNDSTVDDVFSDELFPGNSAEDSGWLFDKIPAMQGSLIHSPSSPSSPKAFPQVDSSNNDHTPLAESHDIDANDDITPTEVESETLSAKRIVPLEGAAPAGSDDTDRLMAPSHPGLPNRDSVESTDTVTEERIEDMIIPQEEESQDSTELNLPAAQEGHVCPERAELEDSVGLGGATSAACLALFDEQQDTDGAELGVAVEADREHIVMTLTKKEGSRKPSEVSSPSSGTAEEVSVVEVSQATSATSNGEVYESCEEGPIFDEDIVATTSSGTSVTATTQGQEVQEHILKVTHSGLPSRPSPLQSPTATSSQLQSPLSKPTSPLARTFAASGSGSTFPPDRGCVVHRSGARPKRLSQTLSPRRGQAMGLQSLLSDDSGTLINGHAEKRASAGHQGNPDDVYLVNRDGTLTNASSGVVYRSGARPKSSSVSGLGMMGRGGTGSGGAGDFGLQGLNSLMVRSTSSCVVHSHVITELTAARSRLNVPELRRTPDRHSVASSDSEYASVESSLATSPTSTSVEELASVGSDTCLLAEVMPVANYPDWMSNLPKRLHAVPLTQLAIPGSNVSFAIESEMRTDMSFSKCNLEMAEFLRKLPPLAVFDNFRKIMKDIWRAWMPKQILSITKQLEAGVRYLDIQITRYRGTFYGEHGLYTRSLKHYLRHVDEFIQQHPKEVIILHFQKFVNLSPKDKRSLVTLLFQFYGAKLCRVVDTANLTLEELWGSKKQIIAIFPDADMPALSNHIFAGLIWSNKVIRSSLPRKQTTSELVTYLESVYDEQREPEEFHVLQAVVSPDMNMVFGDYAHKSMRSLTLCETSPYLKVWLPGKANLNIVTVDFVGIYDLTGEIIRLNEDKKAVTVV